ncbi:hypothetical protein DFH06DRAFT_1215944 [Mycena polygramma]|nr:hypothetical protein DFH06DRAFT_1215944 [Mycena polygramma]
MSIRYENPVLQILTCANLAVSSRPHRDFVHVSLPQSIRHLRHRPDSTVHAPAPEAIFPVPPRPVPQNRWGFSDGPPIHLRELRSLALGYHDELALVPFLDCVRLPSLEALSLQNFALSRDPDIPKGQLYKLVMQSIPPIQPMPLLLSTLLDTLSAPHLLRSLRLIGLSWSEDTDPTDIFDRLGPYLSSLHIVHCPSDFLPELAEAMLASTSPWRLERLTVRGVDGDDLLHCLRIRRAQEYPPLKELLLVPCKRTPPRETLEQFAEVVNMLDLSTYF